MAIIHPPGDGILSQEALDFLESKVRAFQGLPKQALVFLAGSAEPWQCRAGKVVIHQGESTDAMYAIIRGNASVWLQRGHIEVARLGPGDIFGEMSLVERGLANATVLADQDLSAYRIPEDAVLAAIAAYPALKARLLEVTAARKEATRKAGRP